MAASTQCTTDLLGKMKVVGPMAMALVLAVGGVVAYGKSLAAFETMLDRITLNASQIATVTEKNIDLQVRVAVLERSIAENFKRNFDDHKQIMESLREIRDVKPR